MKKETMKELRAWLILISFSLFTFGLCEVAEQIRKPAEQEEMIEEYEDIIRFRIDDVPDKELEAYIEELEPEIVQKPELESLGTFFITAYCPCKEVCSGKWGTQTASGAIATEGRTVAVDPDVIPYGTVLIITINGQEHEYVAEDCGSAIIGKEIDIYFDSHSAAWEFGEQYAEVFIKHKEE